MIYDLNTLLAHERLLTVLEDIDEDTETMIPGILVAKDALGEITTSPKLPERERLLLSCSDYASSWYDRLSDAALRTLKMVEPDASMVLAVEPFMVHKPRPDDSGYTKAFPADPFSSKGIVKLSRNIVSHAAEMSNLCKDRDLNRKGKMCQIVHQVATTHPYSGTRWSNRAEMVVRVPLLSRLWPEIWRRLVVDQGAHRARWAVRPEPFLRYTGLLGVSLIEVPAGVPPLTLEASLGARGISSQQQLSSAATSTTRLDGDDKDVGEERAELDNRVRQVVTDIALQKQAIEELARAFEIQRVKNVALRKTNARLAHALRSKASLVNGSDDEEDEEWGSDESSVAATDDSGSSAEVEVGAVAPAMMAPATAAPAAATSASGPYDVGPDDEATAAVSSGSDSSDDEPTQLHVPTAIAPSQPSRRTPMKVAAMANFRPIRPCLPYPRAAVSEVAAARKLVNGSLSAFAKSLKGQVGDARERARLLRQMRMAIAYGRKPVVVSEGVSKAIGAYWRLPEPRPAPATFYSTFPGAIVEDADVFDELRPFCDAAGVPRRFHRRVRHAMAELARARSVLENAMYGGVYDDTPSQPRWPADSGSRTTAAASSVEGTSGEAQVPSTDLIPSLPPSPAAAMVPGTSSFHRNEDGYCDDESPTSSDDDDSDEESVDAWVEAELSAPLNAPVPANVVTQAGTLLVDAKAAFGTLLDGVSFAHADTRSLLERQFELALSITHGVPPPTPAPQVRDAISAYWRMPKPRPSPLAFFNSLRPGTQAADANRDREAFELLLPVSDGEGRLSKRRFNYLVQRMLRRLACAYDVLAAAHRNGVVPASELR